MMNERMDDGEERSDYERKNNFFETLRIKLGFTSLDDFYDLKVEDVVKNGGKKIVMEYNSLYYALKDAFPDYPWVYSKFSKESWNEERKSFQEPEQTKLIKWMGKELLITSLEDWYRVSRKQIYNLVPSHLMEFSQLKQYLKNAYPEHSWDDQKFQRMWNSTNSSQRHLLVTVKKLFPIHFINLVCSGS